LKSIAAYPGRSTYAHHKQKKLSGLHQMAFRSFFFHSSKPLQKQKPKTVKLTVTIIKT